MRTALENKLCFTKVIVFHCLEIRLSFSFRTVSFTVKCVKIYKVTSFLTHTEAALKTL